MPTEINLDEWWIQSGYAAEERQEANGIPNPGYCYRCVEGDVAGCLAPPWSACRHWRTGVPPNREDQRG